jgi:arylsulfatase A-like enzyme
MLSRRTLLSAAFQQQRRPNFIVIYTDDQGIGDLGCYGHPEVKTPHLDRLAASGIRFTNWYSNSPVCSPSRASVFTGKYPEKHGILDVLTSTAQFDTPGLKPEERTLATELRQAGYRTGHFGKWHMGAAKHSRPMAKGFDEFFGFYSGWTDYLSHRYYTLGRGQSEILHDLWHNDREVWADNEYQTELLGSKAREFALRKDPKPFFMNLWFGAPHYPMMAPPQYVNRFPASMDRDRRLHLAMVAAVDDQVGLLVDGLRRAGQLANTVIFFQSDNGATQETRADHSGRPYRGGSNAPFRGWKQGLFEGGIRVPALLSAPGRIPAGQVRDRIGMAIDVLPTLLQMAGLATPPGVDGVDALARDHDAIHWVYTDSRAVRKGDWKLILNPPKYPEDPFGQPTEKLWLSNLKDDPGERRNWASQNPAKVAELEKLLPA